MERTRAARRRQGILHSYIIEVERNACRKWPANHDWQGLLYVGRDLEDWTTGLWRELPLSSRTPGPHLQVKAATEILAAELETEDFLQVDKDIKIQVDFITMILVSSWRELRTVFHCPK